MMPIGNWTAGLLGLLILGTTQAATTSLVPITFGEQQTVYPGPNSSSGPHTAFAGDKLVFMSLTPRENDTVALLWASDGSNDGTVLLSDTAIAATGELLQLGEEVFFLAKESEYAAHQVWVTDGTPAGTRAFSEQFLGRGSAKRSGAGLFFYDTQDRVLYVSDGHSLTALDPNASNGPIMITRFINNLCAFTSDDFVNNGSVNDEFALVRYQNGQLTDLSSTITNIPLEQLLSSVQTGNSCFMRVLGDGQHT